MYECENYLSYFNFSLSTRFCKNVKRVPSKVFGNKFRTPPSELKKASSPLSSHSINKNDGVVDTLSSKQNLIRYLVSSINPMADMATHSPAGSPPVT